MPLPTAVLIVDDDPDFRALVRTYLSDETFTVAEAPNGKLALECMAQRYFDLIVLDIVMPDCEGLELIGVIRRQSPTSRILAVSGVSQRSLYLNMAEHFGADMALEKPVTRESFSWFVRQLLLPGSPRQ